MCGLSKMVMVMFVGFSAKFQIGKRSLISVIILTASDDSGRYPLVGGTEGCLLFWCVVEMRCVI